MFKFSRMELLAGGIVISLLILFPLVFTKPFPIHVMIVFFMFAMMGVAWNILGGYAGMFSFGQVAFFAIGAYTSSLLLMKFNLTPWIGMLGGGLLAMIVAVAIGYPCTNLRGHYFAIASIAFGEIMRTIFTNWHLVGAAEGLTIPMLPESFRVMMFHTSKAPYYYIMLGFLLFSLVVCYLVANSKIGYYLRAIKESHDVAKVLGVDVARYRLIAISVSAFLTAMAGTFYAQYILYLDPESVAILPISTQIVLVAMLGGAGTILGPVVGAAILIPLSEITRVYLGYKGTGVDMIIYGTLITVISMYQPAGVWGFITSFGKRSK